MKKKKSKLVISITKIADVDERFINIITKHYMYLYCLAYTDNSINDHTENIFSIYEGIDNFEDNWKNIESIFPEKWTSFNVKTELQELCDLMEKKNCSYLRLIN